MTSTTAFPQQSAHRDAYATPENIQAGHVTGIGYAVSVETGKPIPVYMNDDTPPPPAPTAPVPAAQAVIVHQAPRDPWPARILSSGGALSGTAVAVGHYATGIAHAAEGTAALVAAAAVTIALVRNGAPRVSVQINSTISGATSYSASTSSSRSASGWKPSS